MRAISESQINEFVKQGYIFVGTNNENKKVLCLFNRYFVVVK